MADDYLDDDEEQRGIIVSFEVVKKHHKYTWLHQSRVLQLTKDSVMNCKRSSRDPQAPLECTKAIPYKSISAVAVRGQTKFCLRVENDHTYFYASPHALSIALSIQKRVSAVRAVDHLVGETCGNTEEHTMLMKSFIRGDLQLPQYTDETTRKRGMTRLGSKGARAMAEQLATRKRSATTSGATVTEELHAAENEVFLMTLSLRHEIERSFRGGYFKSELTGARRLTSSLQDTAPSAVDLVSVRHSLSDLRAALALSIQSEASQKRFPGLAEEIEDDSEFPCRLADCLLQHEIFGAPLMLQKLWSVMLATPGLAQLQVRFEENAARIANKKPEDFGISQKMMSMQFGLVTTLMKSLSVVATPTAHLDQLVSIAKAIVLTVEANTRILEEKRRRGASLAEINNNKREEIHCEDPALVTSLSADDVLPLYIYLLTHANVPNLVYLREWISTLGDTDECSERTYHFTMFASAVEYILSGDVDTVTTAVSPKPTGASKHQRSIEALSNPRDVEVDSALDSLDDSQQSSASSLRMDNDSASDDAVTLLSDDGGRVSVPDSSDIELPV